MDNLSTSAQARYVADMDSYRQGANIHSPDPLYSIADRYNATAYATFDEIVEAYPPTKVFTGYGSMVGFANKESAAIDWYNFIPSVNAFVLMFATKLAPPSSTVINHMDVLE